MKYYLVVYSENSFLMQAMSVCNENISRCEI